MPTWVVALDAKPIVVLVAEAHLSAEIERQRPGVLSLHVGRRLTLRTLLRSPSLRLFGQVGCRTARTDNRGDGKTGQRTR